MSNYAALGLADDHVHSTAGSADARATVMQLCERAIALGLCRICLTEHLDFDRNLPEYGYYSYQKAYQAVEEARNRYGTQLEIRMGLEVDFETRFLGEIAPVVEKLPVDFCLGAVHVYRGEHFVAYRESGRLVFTAEELSALYRHYFAEVRQVIESGVIDCIAHLDYPGKLGFRTVDGSPIPGYTDEMEATLQLAVKRGVGLEINTKRARVGAPFAAPAEAVKRYVAIGGDTVTLGSDTHNTEQLADSLELGSALLREAGLAYQTIFRERRAERMPLGV